MESIWPILFQQSLYQGQRCSCRTHKGNDETRQNTTRMKGINITQARCICRHRLSHTSYMGGCQVLYNLNITVIKLPPFHHGDRDRRCLIPLRNCCDIVQASRTTWWSPSTRRNSTTKPLYMGQKIPWPGSFHPISVSHCHIHRRSSQSHCFSQSCTYIGVLHSLLLFTSAANSITISAINPFLLQ